MRWKLTSTARVWLRVIAVAGAVAVTMIVARGFGTGALGTVPRIAYWLGLVVIGVLIGVPVGRRVGTRAWVTRRPWLAWAVVVACIAPPMAVIVWLLNAWMGQDRLSLSTLVFDVFPGDLVITGAICALAILTRDRTPTETHAAPPDAAPAKFLARLPDKLKGADLWAVEAQDHYLRLHTSKGRDLILMRLSDAIAELDGIEGARTHRSWWAAKAAVASTARAEGRATLTLTDGSEVPVSRGYLKMLREAGWF